MASTNVTNIDFRQFTLWDKMINVDLIDVDGTMVSITTPPPSPSIGRKPTLRIRGSLKPNNLLLAIELRVTNLYLTKPLSDYKTVRVTAGYSSALQVGFSGSVKVAFQELPGPDGVTCFQFFLGNLDVWTSKTFAGKFAAGTLLSEALKTIATDLDLTPIQSFPDTVLPVAVQFTGLTKDLLPKLEKLFDIYDEFGNSVGLRLAPYNEFLLAYRADKGLSTDIIWRLDYITLAKHSSVYEIQAPWVPGIKPGSLLLIDPKYFRQTFAGSQLQNGNTFQVLFEEFDFCTTDDTNYMSLVAVPV